MSETFYLRPQGFRESTSPSAPNPYLILANQESATLWEFSLVSRCVFLSILWFKCIVISPR
jgi:hypothetical protein